MLDGWCLELLGGEVSQKPIVKPKPKTVATSLKPKAGVGRLATLPGLRSAHCSFNESSQGDGGGRTRGLISHGA